MQNCGGSENADWKLPSSPYMEIDMSNIELQASDDHELS